jgi:hypothetical protein
MKKSILAAAMLFMASAAFAQAPHVYPVTVAGSPAALPSTTVKVYLTVEKEAVRTGVYARYAQKYLGVIAPLADRETCSIVAARLDYADPDRQPAPAATASPATDATGFPRVQIDRMSELSRSTEEAARDAAATIFRLRRQRLDILTGDAGELYPGGTDAVLSEIRRMEEEYLALFLGRETRSVEVCEIDVVPTAGKGDYTVCRFSPVAGVSADGEAVTLAMTPDGGVRQPVAERGDRREMAQYRVADFADCRLSYDGRQLAALRIPVYQFGETVTAPAK